MAQPQRQADVHQDELCPPNKRYALLDANKKIDLKHPLCPNESKILVNILQNQPLRFSIVASSSVPWIYLGQFWHNLKEDGSKYRLKFVLDKKELTMTLDDYRTIFHLPQATDNNHDHFVPALKFLEMVPFYINNLGFILELRSPSNFKTTALIMQMLYCFVNNIHVDYADLLWEGFHYSLEHLTTLNPYPRFTKLIVSHYMTEFPQISKRAHDKYHNLEDDEMVKSIFNSGKNKAGVGMKILSWMITDDMKLTKNYRMYVAVFRVDIPMTQSQPIESTQGTHRTTSAPRSPNPDVDKGDSSAQRKSTVIRLCIPPRRSTRLTPPTPIPTTAKADDIILQDKIQLRLADQKSHDKLEAKQNVQKVKEHLIAEEIEKLIEGTKNVVNVEVDSSTLRKNDNQNDPGTRLKPRSNKESPKVEINAEVQPVNTIEEEEESAEDDYELRRREKKKEELMITDPKPSSYTPSSSSPKPKLSASQHILSLFKPKTGRFKRYKSFVDELQGCYKYLFKHLKTRFMPRKKFHELAQHLQEVMEESLPKMMQLSKNARISEAENFSQINNAISNHIPSQVDSSIRNYMSGHILHVRPDQASPASTQEQQYQLYLTIKDNPQLQQDDLPIWLALKYKFERLHVFDTPCRPSAICLRDQDDPHDNAHPEGENSAKRQKTSEHGTYMFGESSAGQVNESEPGLSTSSNQEQLDDFDFLTYSYSIDDDELPTKKVSQELVEEMSQTVDEEKLRKVVNEMLRQRCTSGDEHQYHIDQMKNFLKNDIKGNSGPEKISLSLHKFLAVRFPNDDIEERTSRNLLMSNKFITDIIARRANGSIVSITESDYKNLNKNDIEDMYLLMLMLGVESYQQKFNLIAPTITFPGIKKYKVFSIISKPVYGIIYKNNKKEKRVMRHQEIHKFCDATFKRVWEGLNSYNNNVKHGLSNVVRYVCRAGFEHMGCEELGHWYQVSGMPTSFPLCQSLRIDLLSGKIQIFKEESLDMVS
ncbi:retrovirus-related pol polyprotein from transposon TNT 1-94 [Tanacetum coccineum]